MRKARKMTRTSRYRVIEHTADVGIMVFGRGAGELFANAGEALFDMIFGLSNIRPDLSGGAVYAQGRDREELLVSWLGALLLKFELEKFIPARFAIDHIDRTSLAADVFGEEFDPRRHSALADIKGVTYHGLSITEEPGRWTAEVIFDV